MFLKRASTHLRKRPYEWMAEQRRPVFIFACQDSCYMLPILKVYLKALVLASKMEPFLLRTQQIRMDSAQLSRPVRCLLQDANTDMFFAISLLGGVTWYMLIVVCIRLLFEKGNILEIINSFEIQDLLFRFLIPVVKLKH